MLKRWFAAFKAEHPGVEIEWLDKKGPDVPPFYQTQLAGGTPPDVVDLQGGIGIEYAAQGALLDLTPYLTAHPDVKARYNPRSPEKTGCGRARTGWCRSMSRSRCSSIIRRCSRRPGCRVRRRISTI